MVCRVRLLKGQPYTQKEADAAVGLGTDNGRGIEKPQHSQADAEDVEMSG